MAGELNSLQPMCGDIGNAYLEAYTKEKVYIVAGPEFEELEGHVMKIVKALYGLRSSGARFHDCLADTLKDLGFMQCKADPDLWLKDAGDCYEYICVYVDDLLTVMKDGDTFFQTLINDYNYKLKGVGPPKYHLGGNFYHDSDGTLVWGARTYIQRLLSNYETMFGGPPKKYSAPLDKDDSPELDESEELSAPDITKYQSLIGALQWCITLGRFDISCAVMVLSRFRTAPCKGHLECAQRVCGYLKRVPEGGICFCTGIPAHEDHFQVPTYDWMYTVYGNLKEELPPDMPPPKGHLVRTTSYVDANLMHCKVTGKSATGILHLVNQTPIAWFSKRQATVETATYGSEFVAARQATEQIMDLRYTLMYMGLPLDGPSWLFGDNKSVITSSTIPHSMLGKRHNALAYHRVHASIASGVSNFIHIDGTDNVADVLTKFLPYVTFWPFVQPLLFWKGETTLQSEPEIGECQV